jgi:hypothetical protein
MARLDSAANEVRRLARKRAQEKIKKEKAPKIWNGKKVIPLAEWRKKQNIVTKEWMDYYPDKYTPNLLIYAGEYESLAKLQDEWWPGFVQYMESVKDPEFGKLKCRECILNPIDSEPNAPGTTTIRDAIVKTNQSIDGKPLEFPCKVINMFKCPYQNKDDQQNFLFLGYMWRILEYALKYNAKLVERKHNMYTVDFDKKKVRAWCFNVGFEVNTVEQLFSKLKFPKVEILGHKGLYDTITTRDKLKIVLTEYLDALAEGIEYNTHDLKFVEYLRKEPAAFLEVFDMIKDTITLEELKNTDGMTLRERERENKEYEEFLAQRRKMEGIHSEPEQKKLSGACFSCGEFANIFCENCDIWTCLEHGMDHDCGAAWRVEPEESSTFSCGYCDYVTNTETDLHNHYEATHIETRQKELERYNQMKWDIPTPTHYDILGVDRNATQDEITKQYRKLVLVWHPDQNTVNLDVVEHLKTINKSYKVIRDKDKRREYDTSLGF